MLSIQFESSLCHWNPSLRLLYKLYLLCSTIPIATASCFASMAISKIFWFLSFTDTSCSDLESRYFRISAWPPLAAMWSAVFWTKKKSFALAYTPNLSDRTLICIEVKVMKYRVIHGHPSSSYIRYPKVHLGKHTWFLSVTFRLSGLLAKMSSADLFDPCSAA